MNNSTTMTIIESWFIPLDILMIVCTSLAILLSTLFLCIIAWDKACHTVSMMLIANSCVSALILGCALLSMRIFTLNNDLQRIEYQDSLCIVRSYFDDGAFALFIDSYLLQALYRYLSVVYPTRLFWRSAKFQLFCIFITWIFGFLYQLVFMFSNEVIYNVDNQICQLPLSPSFSFFYVATYAYFIPMSLIMLIYFKLVRYVRAMSQRVLPTNTLLRAQRELKMVQRTVILIIILITVGFPYTVFLFMSIFTSPPKYHFRIAYTSVDVSIASVMMALFQFTDPLKAYVMKIIQRRPTRIVAAINT